MSLPRDQPAFVLIEGERAPVVRKASGSATTTRRGSESEGQAKMIMVPDPHQPRPQPIANDSQDQAKAPRATDALAPVSPVGANTKRRGSVAGATGVLDAHSSLEPAAPRPTGRRKRKKQNPSPFDVDDGVGRADVRGRPEAPLPRRGARKAKFVCRLEINLEIEIELKVRIQGDLTLELF